MIAGQMFQLWHKYIELITLRPKRISSYLKNFFDERVRDRYAQLCPYVVDGEKVYLEMSSAQRTLLSLTKET